MNKPADPDDPRGIVAAALRRLSTRRLTTASGGNISLRVGDRIWITPAGGDKTAITPRDIAVVDRHGASLDVRRPSSELALHVALHRVRRDRPAVIHAHAPALVAFSLAHRIPDLARLPDAALRCGPVGFVPYARTGTTRLGQLAAETLGPGGDAAVLENHGVVVAGGTMADAMVRLEILEAAAAILIRADALASSASTDATVSPTRLEEDAGEAAEQVPAPAELQAIVQRCRTLHLLVPGLGAASLRRGDRFLLTGAGRDWGDGPGPLDALPLDIPASTFRRELHRRLYLAHRAVRVVLEALPPHASAFGLAGWPISTRTIAEAFLLLDEIQRPSADWSIDDLVERLSPERPAALTPGGGAIVVGASVFEAYDRLEVLDATAAACLDAGSLGGVHLLDDTATAALATLRRSRNPTSRSRP